MVERSQIPVFRQEPVLVLILGFITCGLYYIYWNLKIAEVLNAVADREAISPVIAALAGCCMPVHIFFYYQVGQVLSDLGRITGRGPELKDRAVLLLVLSVFFPPAAAMILQDHVNEIYEPIR